jgi:hypothetical protein
MAKSTSNIQSILAAANSLLQAREDGMLTSEEWEGLARAVEDAENPVQTASRSTNMSNGLHKAEGWHYRTADAPGTSLRFVIETHPAEWDRYAVQDDEGTRGDWVCFEPGYRRVAMTTDGGPEAARDARLIAAAPALLAACEAFVAEHDDLQGTMYDCVETPPSGGWKCGCDCCKSARAAIAAAYRKGA